MVFAQTDLADESGVSSSVRMTRSESRRDQLTE
jgi:hypothetical protein